MKRFTDTELAAEWARSAFVTGIHGPHAEGSRTEVLRRFATLPHYDEAPAG